MKKLKVGQRVTVVGKASGKIVHATFYGVRPAPDGGMRMEVLVQVLGTVEVRREFESEEGITWARGWRGKAVDALRAYIALNEVQSPPDLGLFSAGVIGSFMRKTYDRFVALSPEQQAAVAAAGVAAISALAKPLARKT
jgi:hypothetical protein